MFTRLHSVTPYETVTFIFFFLFRKCQRKWNFRFSRRGGGVVFVLDKLLLNPYFRFAYRGMLWGCYWVPGSNWVRFLPSLCLRCFILYSRAIPTLFLPADVLEFLLWVVVVFCDLWLSVCVHQVGRKFGFWHDLISVWKELRSHSFSRFWMRYILVRILLNCAEVHMIFHVLTLCAVMFCFLEIFPL